MLNFESGQFGILKCNTDSMLSKSPVAGEASMYFSLIKYRLSFLSIGTPSFCQDMSHRGTHSMRQVKVAFGEECKMPVYGGKFLMKNGGACTSKFTVAITPLPPSLYA
uniref:RT09851p n=1 Tax=Drosophila melanogaster TaxID=7227 RepID=E0R950_DROME|nr:RT09851p [Drosophila melanogaster]